VPGDRSAFLTALGSVRDPQQVSDVLEYVLTGPLRPQEVFQLPDALANYAPNRDAIYRWLQTRYPEILTRIPAHMMTRVMPMLRGCAPERLASAQQFFADPSHTFPAAGAVVARVGDSVADCVRLHDRDAERFERYLRSESANP
jgi:hypothetical protein